jgi:curli biogenesis system outer membrane secretion channel CsgG
MLGLVLSCVSAGPGAASPQDKTAERIVEASGPTLRAAILDGLVQAEQECGIRVDEKTVASRKFQDAIRDLKQTFESSDVDSSEIQTASGGLIDGYDVLEKKEDPQTHHFSVSLKVRVLVYDPEAPFRGGRLAIAVIPFRCSRDRFQILNSDLAERDLVQQLSQDLVEQLVQSRKFTVLDRDFLAESIGEKKLIESEKMPLAEQLRIGQGLGADLLLVGRIDDMEAHSEAKTIHLTGQSVDRGHAKTTISYRILNVATGKIHWADTFNHFYNDEELRALSAGQPDAPSAQSLVRSAADGISEQVITGVFPIRVIKADDRSLILNQGAKRLKIGEVLDVYTQGEELLDPDTKEYLHPLETLVGQVRVARLDTQQAYATLESGNPAKIVAEKTVCRRHADTAGKYIRHVGNGADSNKVAILVKSEEDALDESMARSLADVLRSNYVRAEDGFFTDAFIADGLFDRWLDGSERDFKASSLSAQSKYAILAQKRDTLASSRELKGLITGTGRLDIHVIRTSDGQFVEEFSVAAKGSGTTQADAEERLDDNLAQKIKQHGFGNWTSDLKQLDASH